MERQAYHLVDDIDVLREAIVSQGDFKGGNRLGVSRSASIGEFSAYASCYDLSNPEIAHKYSHTLRVTLDADEMATRAVSGEPLYAPGKVQLRSLFPAWRPDSGVCFLMGLLHDLGRFPQYAMYRTYSDMGSFPHAEISYAMLADFKMLRKFVNVADDDHEGKSLADCMLRSIRCHSLLDVSGTTGSERAYYDILRDADKIDILEAYCHAISSPDFKALVDVTEQAMAGNGELPSVAPADAPFINEMARMRRKGFAVSDGVADNVRRGGLVDRRNIQTAADATLSCLAMYSGMETQIAKDIISERHTMEVIEESVIESYGAEDPSGEFVALVRLISCQ